jgi:hypothetical protein
MCIAPCDSGILRSDEIFRLYDEYREKFGEEFICFNYADFHRMGEKCAAQVYLETLKEAVKADKPYHIVSHRYDDFDH